MGNEKWEGVSWSPSGGFPRTDPGTVSPSLVQQTSPRRWQAGQVIAVGHEQQGWGSLGRREHTRGTPKK